MGARWLLLQVLVCFVSAKPPNFLILFADDMGYGDMSCVGHPTIKTPALDQLAAEGMRFTQWYSAFSVCSPSRAAMLTGRIPIRSGCTGTGWLGGVFRNDAVGGLPTNETTFAQLLGQNGYKTCAVGKWHLGQRKEYLPTSRGFDEYLGIPFSDDMGASAWKRDGDTPLPLLGNTTIIEQPANLDTLAERYTQYTIDFMTRSVAEDKPFVMYMAWNHVHVPDFANKEFCNTTRRGRYGDAMSSMDNGIGKIMASLKTLGIQDNTLTFFTSDNGPWLIKKLSGGSAGLLYEGKTTTWEGGVREPAIVHWPGKVAAGSLTEEVAATYDIFSTMLKLADVPEPSDRIIDGRDLSDIIFNGGKTKHTCLFIYKGSPEGPEKPGLWAIRCGAYKTHYFTNTHLKVKPIKHSPPLIYQIEHDPSEKYPLNPNSEEYQAQTKIFDAAKAQHLANLKVVPNQMARGTSKDYALCCDPQSHKKYPTFPNCTCNPENWSAFVCSPLGPTFGSGNIDLVRTSTNEIDDEL